MGNRLAIKGHPTRSKEVVELLRMMGGNDSNDFKCSNPNRLYSVLNGHCCWDYIGFEEIDKYELFTLEEFLVKYPFFVGAGVLDIADGNTGTIGGMKWDEDVSDMKYHVFFDNGDMGWYTNDTIALLKEDENLEETQSNQDVDNFRKEFCEYCGSQRCSGQDDELEYCERFKNLIDRLETTSVKNHKMGPKSKLPSKYYEEIQTKRDIDKSEFVIKHMMLPNKVDDKLEFKIVDGYEVDKIENGNIILKPIKPKYPKTYAECCEVLDFCGDYFLTTYEADCVVNKKEVYGILQQVNSLTRLLICKSAYWKIAGEEMGLDGPWKPDYNDLNNITYYGLYNKLKCSIINPSQFVFPTTEMRDAFCENFKDLIESSNFKYII